MDKTLKTYNRLSPRDWVAAADWLQEKLNADQFELGITPHQVAALATTDLGINITAGNVIGILKEDGLSLPKTATKASMEERVAKLEAVVARICEKLDCV